MNGYREADSPIVSGKPSNKTGGNKPVAEKVEKRGLAERDLVERNKDRALNRGTLPSEPTRIRQNMFINNLRVITRGRAQCISSARWDLCGGCRVTGIPTANSF